jgi:hypothetical protein
MVAFIESASGHLGVDKDDILEIITNSSYSKSLNYTVVTDAYNVWADGIRFAKLQFAKKIGVA